MREPDPHGQGFVVILVALAAIVGLVLWAVL